MDVGRSALRGGEPVKSAAAAAAMAWPADMAEVQRLSQEAQSMATEALMQAAAVTETWTKNVMEMGWEPIVGSSSCRAYGPTERDVVGVYDATFPHRKQVAGEVNAFVRAFEKREEKYQKTLAGAQQQLKSAHATFESNMAKSENIDKVNDAIRAACKSVQEKLECEIKCEEEREKARAMRFVAAEAQKKSATAEINERRENIQFKFKSEEERLYAEYDIGGGKMETEDYV